MLPVKPRKISQIVSVERVDNALLIQQDNGILRIKPQNENIVRISLTQRENFSTHLAIGVEKDNDFSNWSYEFNENVTLKMPKLTVVVNGHNSSIHYYDEKGKLLLSEKNFESKELESYQTYKTVVDENTKTAEIDTADGKKQVILEATTVEDREMYHAKVNFEFQDNEKLYGLGQAEEGSLNLRGTTQYLHQANLKIAIPMLLSTAGYGILFATDSASIFNDNEYGSYFYSYCVEFLDYYFIAGSKFEKVIKGYRFLTGKAVMLPRWAFGFMQSQERYETQDEILSVANEYRNRNIGLDSIVLDWRSWEGETNWGQKTFDLTRFPNPTEMTQKLHDINVKFMISIWPNMRGEGENHKEFAKANLFIPTNVIYDAFNKKARDLYWKQANEGLFCHGIDAWWCDSSEPICPEWMRERKLNANDMYNTYIDVTTKYFPDDIINAYGYVHSKTISDGQRATTDKKRVMNLTRNSYIGGQKYGVVLWSGDTYASWKTLKNQIVAGLNFCATGMPYWTLDIGAFFVGRGARWFWSGDYVNGLDDLGYKELFVRWFQYGAFLPIFRSHGTEVRREMWKFEGQGNMFYDALVKANQLRYTLLHYIYSLSAQCYFNDDTIMKLLAFDFADDDIATSIKDEYMFGSSLLVCPVVEPMYYGVNSEKIENKEKSRSVYLPKGTVWYDFYTNEKYDGGQTIKAECELDKMPLYVKAGSILPLTKPLQSTAEMDNAKIELRCYSGADSTFELYEDSGDGYGYEKGEYTFTTIDFKDNKLDISNNSDRFEIKII